MLAYRLREWQQPPQVTEVPVPEPGPGQVRIRVGGSGACATDLHVGTYPPGHADWPLPFTLGHETAGWIDAHGPGAQLLDDGQPVVVYTWGGCGICRQCRLSHENQCERRRNHMEPILGLGLDGGMAEYMLVPSPRLLIPLDRLSPAEGAPLADAGVTAYHAIVDARDRLVPGSSAVVIGIGGLGHLALQILLEISPALVIAVSRSADHLAQAEALGARAVPLDADSGAAIRDLTSGRGADLVVDMVGVESTVALAAGIARPGGLISLVGGGGASIPVAFMRVPSDCHVVAPTGGSVTELMEVVALAENGRLQPLIERFPLMEAPTAYERLRAGTLRGRAVIVPTQ